MLKDLTPAALEEGKRYIAENRINIGAKANCCDLLYIEITCEADGRSETAIIEGSHTHFTSPAPSEGGEGLAGGVAFRCSVQKKKPRGLSVSHSISYH